MNEKIFYLALNETGSIGYRRFRILLKYADMEQYLSCPDLVWRTSLSLSVKVKVYKALKNIDRASSLYQQIEKRGNLVYTANELSHYVGEVSDIPLMLSGSFPLEMLPAFSRRVAVVGTCSPAPQAREITASIISYLSKENVLIISGFARGIDRVAHLNAVHHKLKTLAFLPYGIGNFSSCYPAKGGIYYLSEAPFHEKWLKKWAILRNRLIALFSDAVIVIQSRADGGSFYTASYGLNYGRKVCAVKFKNDPCQGNKKLLQLPGVHQIRSRADLHVLWD